jgi:hypothetical protein
MSSLALAMRLLPRNAIMMATKQQLLFEYVVNEKPMGAVHEGREINLDKEAIAVAIGLVAQALIAVAQFQAEAADEQ